MKESNLKQRATAGFMWSIGERFGNLAADFVISIFLARILAPKEFGIIAMVGVFTALLSPFIDAGLGKALIRKKGVTDEDYSTVFWWNLGLSGFIYVIIFLCAPLVARFYKEPLLTDVVRVMGVTLILQALSMVQTTRLTKEINFKTLTIRGLASNIPSGLLGLYLAFQGWSYWALVIRLLVNAALSTILLWSISGWKPSFRFSTKSFREFFGFGSKLLASSLLDTFFNNLYPLVIGKFFSTASLGLYSRAKSFVGIPQNLITSVTGKVTYPIFAEMQSTGQNLRSGYSRLMQIMSYAYFPVLTLVMGLSHSIVIVLLTEKWIGTVPILKAVALAGLLYPVHSLNLNILTVKGRSDLFLYLEIAKKVMVVLIIVFTFRFGIMGLVYGQIFQSWCAFLINSYFTRRFIEYNIWEQFLDILPNLVISLSTGLAVMWASESVGIFTWYSLLGWFIAGGLLYLLINFIRKSKEQNYILGIVLSRLPKKKILN